MLHLRDIGRDVWQQEMSLLLGLAQRRVGPRFTARDINKIIPSETGQVEVFGTFLVEESASWERQIQHQGALIQELHTYRHV